jgi:hypothetical protein
MKQTKSSMVKERKVMEQEAEALMKKKAAANRARNLKGSFIDTSHKQSFVDDDY